MILVTTPNGNTGSQLLPLLSRSDAPLRVLSYRPERLAPEVRARVEVHEGSLDDEAALRRAFRGVRSVFWCVPQSFQWEQSAAYYDRFTDAALSAALSAAQTSGAPVRFVCVGGGGYGVEQAGPATALSRMEDRLNASGLPMRHLRCGYFMENLLWAAESIATAGAVFQPIAPEAPLPFVAARDVAACAARWLLDAAWTDQYAQPVYGPEDLSMNAAMERLSASLGRPVRYHRAAPEQVRALFLSMGSNEGFVREYLAMAAAFSAGAFQRDARTPESTTPTTLDLWASETLAPALASTPHGAPA